MVVMLISNPYLFTKIPVQDLLPAPNENNPNLTLLVDEFGFVIGLFFRIKLYFRNKVLLLVSSLNHL